MATIYQPLFIAADDRGLMAYVESGFDQGLLSQHIWDTQELWIHPILGTALFNKLCTDIRTNALTGNYLTLVTTKIRPALMWYTLAEGAHIFTYRIRKQGLVKQNSENSVSADIQDIDRAVKNFESKAQTYAERLKNYLIENSDLFTEYENAGDGVDTIYPNAGTQYNVGWVMNNNRFGTTGYNPCCNGEENTVDL